MEVNISTQVYIQVNLEKGFNRDNYKLKQKMILDLIRLQLITTLIQKLENNCFKNLNGQTILLMNKVDIQEIKDLNNNKNLEIAS